MLSKYFNCNFSGLFRGLFLGRRGGEVKTPPPLPPAPSIKLVRIMLETSNLARKCTHLYSSENIPFSTKTYLILLMSAFFEKNQCLLPKIGPLLQSIVESFVRDLLVLFSVVLQTMRPESGFRLASPNCP